MATPVAGASPAQFTITWSSAASPRATSSPPVIRRQDTMINMLPKPTTAKEEKCLACTQTSMRRTPKQPTLRTAVDREGNRNFLLPVTQHVNWDHARYHPNFRGCAIRTFENSKKMSCANCTRKPIRIHVKPPSHPIHGQSLQKLTIQAAVDLMPRSVLTPSRHKDPQGHNQRTAAGHTFRKPSDPTSPSRG